MATKRRSPAAPLTAVVNTAVQRAVALVGDERFMVRAGIGDLRTYAAARFGRPVSRLTAAAMHHAAAVVIAENSPTHDA